MPLLPTSHLPPNVTHIVFPIRNLTTYSTIKTISDRRCHSHSPRAHKALQNWLHATSAVSANSTLVPTHGHTRFLHPWVHSAISCLWLFATPIPSTWNAILGEPAIHSCSPRPHNLPELAHLAFPDSCRKGDLLSPLFPRFPHRLPHHPTVTAKLVLCIRVGNISGSSANPPPPLGFLRSFRKAFLGVHQAGRRLEPPRGIPHSPPFRPWFLPPYSLGPHGAGWGASLVPPPRVAIMVPSVSRGLPCIRQGVKDCPCVNSFSQQ